MLRKTLLVLALIMVSLHARAQVATGVYPYGTFDTKGPDTINIGNLNVHFNISLRNKPGRRQAFTYDLSNDNSIWTPVTSNGTTVWSPTQNWGWRGITEVLFGYVSFSSSSYNVNLQGGQYCTGTTYSSFVYHDGFGVAHAFPGVSTLYATGTLSGCGTSTPSSSQIAPDGSGYTLNVTNYTSSVLTTSEGFTVVPSSSISDTNGNQLTTTSSGVFTDTLGSTVLTVAGTAPNNQTYTYKDLSGNSQSYTVSYAQKTVQTAFKCSGIGEYGPVTKPLINAITFPDGSSYTFGYEPTPGISGAVTGRIASVTLPTGGTISYSYTGGSNGIVCTDGSIAGLTRSLSATGGSAAVTTTYVRSSITATSSSTDVADGASPANHSTYTFAVPSSSTGFYETSRANYSGAATGTPLLSHQTCYNNNPVPCSARTVTLPIAQIDTYESFNGGAQHGATAKYNSYGLQTEQDTYDFGTTSARGNLLRKEVWAYPSSGIVNLVSSDTITDGGGNQIGQTTYAYDETTGNGHAALIATSGLPQHGGTVGSQRGNLTTMTQWNNLGTAITTTSAYEDTGNPVSTTTPNGTSSFAYDSATHAFVITSTPPTPSSGVSLPVSATNDATTGLPLTATDPNGQQTMYKSYDALLRPTEIDFPDGGKTVVNYSSPNIQYAQTYLNSGTSGYVYSDQDAYGRADRVSVYNGQSSNQWYQQDICFDGNGNAQYKTYPYQGIGLNGSKVCSASAGDTYAYDALGRVISITHADNTAIHYSYNGRATEVTDENNVSRISQVDGLGRLVSVCELSTQTLLDGTDSTPVLCNQDIPGQPKGFLTTYTYTTDSNNKNQITTIAQGSSQSRIFVTDSLGRTVSVKEPERGTTTYSYAYNSTGLVVTRKRPKANQPYATTLTTTTTQYDALSRVLSVSYDDSLTPTKQYFYDSSNWAEGGSQRNLKGRLSLAQTSNTGTLYSYDAMGRTTSTWQCTPSGCGNSAYDKHIAFTYDWAGNLTSQYDPSAGNITYGRSPAGEITSVANNTWTLSGSAGTANILSNPVNGPNGAVSYSLANGLSQYNSFDSLGRVNGGWVCVGAPSSACSNPSVPQRNGFYVTWSGSRATGSGENYVGQGMTYQYDDFNRLTGMKNSSGQSTYTYDYDRYGNRWHQNALQGGGTFNQSYDPTTNRLNSGGYVYDAAGNMTQDGPTGQGFHTYTYDAEGNILQVDSGSTGTYVYDAMNHKVSAKTQTVPNLEFIFDLAGHVTSLWTSPTSSNESHIFADSAQIAFRSGDGHTYFNHKNWLNTDRVHTDLNGATAATYTSLPFGDGGSANVSESNGGWDFNRFGDIDINGEDNTYHAQFRQYSQLQARWLSPDPYDGSYDAGNPQSFNRYAYVLNNPMSAIDPDGEDQSQGDCYYTASNCGSGGGGGGVWGGGWGTGLLQMTANWYWNTYTKVTPNGVVPVTTGNGVAADAPPPGYTRSGTNSDGNSIYMDADGNRWIGSPGSPGLSSGGYSSSFGMLSWFGASNSGGFFSGGGGGSGVSAAPNNSTSSTITAIKQKVIRFACSSSPQNKILAAARFGFVNGALRGGIAGATGGVFFEGVGAIPGALVGGFVGGVAGTAGGVITGGATAGVCSLAGVY